MTKIERLLEKDTMRELTGQELDSVAGGVQETRYFNNGGQEKESDSPAAKTSQKFAGNPNGELHPAGQPRDV